MATMWACSHIYESLFTLNENSELESTLIDGYEINEDGTQYIFRLKPNIYFHQNSCFKSRRRTRELTAEDVVYSLSRLIDTRLASPGAWVLKDKIDTMHPFQVLNKYSFCIRLNKKNAQLLNILSMPYCSIIPHEAVQFYGKDFHKNPVGTGPFRFKLWDEGTVLFLERNKIYHQKDSLGVSLPYLDFIKITFNEQKKFEFLEFTKGRLTFITSPDQSAVQTLFDREGQLKSEWSQKINCIKKPFLNTEYMAIMQDTSLLTRKSPLKNRDIRKAINLSIHRDEIVRYIKFGLATAAHKGFVPAGMPNYDSSIRGYEYNPQLARKLILNAGYSKSNPPKLSLHTNNSLIDLAEFLSKQLEQVGFEIDIRLHPLDVMMQLASKGEVDFFRRSWLADYPDAENYFSCFYSKNQSPPNYTRFRNQRFDQLYEAATSELNSKKRRALYRNMEEIILEESIVVPIFYDQSIRLFQKNVQGLEQNVLNQLNLKKVKLI